MVALTHQIANALVHRDARRGHERGHGSYNAVITRRSHHVAGAQDADQFIHVVLIRGQNRHAAQPLGNAIRRTRIQTFGCCEDDKYISLLAEGIDSIRDRSQVMLVGAISSRARVMKIDGAVVTVLLRPRETPQNILRDGRLYRPLKRIDRAYHQHGSLSVPSHLPQNALSVLWRARFEGPGEIGRAS